MEYPPRRRRDPSPCGSSLSEAKCSPNAWREKGVVAKKGRILLANLFPRGTAVIAALDSPGFYTCKNGICKAQLLALGGAPTVSGRSPCRRAVTTIEP